jgi:hypothetical protein
LIQKPNASDIRVKKNLYGTLIKSFDDSLSKYQSVNSDIKNIMQDKILREATIIYNGKLSDDDRKKILENPEILQDQMRMRLTDKPSAKLTNAYNDIKERHEDIVRLERVRIPI